MPLAPLPTTTYASRESIVRYANRYAQVGDQLVIVYADIHDAETPHAAEVTAVRPGRHVRTVEARVATADASDTFVTQITDDAFNNLSDFNIVRVELYRPRR